MRRVGDAHGRCEGARAMQESVEGCVCVCGGVMAVGRTGATRRAASRSGEVAAEVAARVGACVAEARKEVGRWPPPQSARR